MLPEAKTKEVMWRLLPTIADDVYGGGIYKEHRERAMDTGELFLQAVSTLYEVEVSLNECHEGWQLWKTCFAKATHPSRCYSGRM